MKEPIKPRKPSLPYCPQKPVMVSDTNEVYISKNYSSFDGDLKDLLNDFINHLKLNKNISNEEINNISISDIRVKLYYECYYENSDFDFTLTYKKPLYIKKTTEELRFDEVRYKDDMKKYNSKLNYYNKSKKRYDEQMIIYNKKLEEYNNNKLEYDKIKQEKEKEEKIKLFNKLKKELNV